MYQDVLKVCSFLKLRIAAEKSRLNRYKDLIDNLTAEIDGLPRAQNSAKSKVEGIAALIVDTEKTISALIEIKIDCILELQKYLFGIISNDAAREVILYRYGLCLPFNDIAARLHYSARKIFYLHSLGIDELKRLAH